jgi:methionyl-tRNA formyltransferase
VNQYVVATIKPWNIKAFERRRMVLPGQWHFPADGDFESLYDHIRMLDAETYPLAFVEYGAYRLEFSSAELRGNTLRAQVEIRTKDEGRKS